MTMLVTQAVFVFVLFGCFLSVFCSCPGGWSRYKNSCFHVSRDTASWAEAEKMCEIHGSFLATIEDAAENQFIKTELATHRHSTKFWVAGSDWANEGMWKWTPDEKTATFTDWHHGQPDNGHLEHCLSLHRVYKYQWADDNCQSQQHYVCERHDISNGTTMEPQVLG